MKGLNIKTMNVSPPDRRKIFWLGSAPKSATPTWKSYVQDGLIFQLDCQNGFSKDGGNTYWQDLKSGVNLYLTDGEATKKDNCIEFDKYAIFGHFPIDSRFDNDLTIEICASLLEPQILEYCGPSVSVFINKKLKGVELSESILAYNETAEYKHSFGYNVGEVYSVSGLSNDIIRVNNEPVEYTADAPYEGEDEDYIYIMTNSAFTICSIRIYNRKLLENELSKNYAVDQARFMSKQFTLDDSELDGNDYLV